jgi:hypothetical protein
MVEPVGERAHANLRSDHGEAGADSRRRLSVIRHLKRADLSVL